MEFEVDFTTPVYGGDTLGRLPDGRAVFAPFLLPGERARIRLVEEKRGYARGQVVERLTANPQRGTPRCAHFGVCGGCHYQHLAYPDQLALKGAVLRDQFVRIAGIPEPPIQPMHACPSPWNYRNVLQFHLDPQGKLGFQRADGGGVLAIHECHLPEPELAELWPQLSFEPLPGLERIALRQGAEGEAMLILESDDGQAPELSVEELPVSVVHLGPDGPLVLAGEDGLWMVVRERAFRVSAGAFFQVNTAMAGEMVAHLLDVLAVRPEVRALDLYSGVGLFSAFLAERGAAVTAVEASPAACEDFALNLDEFEDVALYQGEAGQVLPGLQGSFDLAVVDPPRAGLERPALDALLHLAPPVLAYVSCDPATLARDVRRLLAGGYTLRQVTPFDLFPQTYHIESISLLTRRID